MEIKKHAEQADQGWGSIYYNVIPSIINKFNVKIMAEIGVAFGGHLEKILTTTNIEKAYGIDPYTLYPTTTDQFLYDQEKYDQLFEFIKQRLEKFGARAVLLRDTSYNSSKKINDEYLDLVFIDAEHTFEAVETDLIAWSSKVKTGGIISGHDYDHPNFKDVRKAVDAWVENNNYNLNIEEGYVWWVIKQ